MRFIAFRWRGCHLVLTREVEITCPPSDRNTSVRCQSQEAHAFRRNAARIPHNTSLHATARDQEEEIPNRNLAFRSEL